MRYFLFILLAGLLSACSSDDESNAAATAAKLEVSKNEVKLSNVDGSFTINVTATSAWTAEVTSTDGWLSISKNSGEGNGDLRLFFTKNTDGPKRTGTGKVSMSGAGSALEQEISVEQLGADPDILFDCSSDPLSFREGTFTCKVVANVEWELEIAEEYNWIKLQETTPQNSQFCDRRSNICCRCQYEQNQNSCPGIQIRRRLYFATRSESNPRRCKRCGDYRAG